MIPPQREDDPASWRDQEDRFGVGDYVTRDGADVHQVVSLNHPHADTGVFRCVVEPQPWFEDGEPWIRAGETEDNLTRRYSPVHYEERTDG